MTKIVLSPASSEQSCIEMIYEQCSLSSCLLLQWQTDHFVPFHFAEQQQKNKRLIIWDSQLTAQQFLDCWQGTLQYHALSIHISKPHVDLSPSVVITLKEDTDEWALRPTLAQFFSKINTSGWTLQSHSPKLQQPGLLVMDMDSTAIQIECIDEMAKLAGVGDQVVEITRRAMSGEIDFDESLRQRVGLLVGLPQEVIESMLKNLPLMPGLQQLVQTLKQHEWKIVIASGGFTYFTEYLKRELQLDKTVANILEMTEGKLTGEVLGAIVNAQTKADVLRDCCDQWGLKGEQTVAIGDGANDLVMIEAAGLGVAFHAKPTVNAQTLSNIQSGSLLQLLYLMEGDAC